MGVYQRQIGAVTENPTHTVLGNSGEFFDIHNWAVQVCPYLDTTGTGVQMTLRLSPALSSFLCTDSIFRRPLSPCATRRLTVVPNKFTSSSLGKSECLSIGCPGQCLGQTLNWPCFFVSTGDGSHLHQTVKLEVEEESSWRKTSGCNPKKGEEWQAPTINVGSTVSLIRIFIQLYYVKYFSKL